MKNYHKSQKAIGLRMRLQGASEGLSQVLQNCINIKMNILFFVKSKHNNETTIIMNDTTKSQSSMYI